MPSPPAENEVAHALLPPCVVGVCEGRIKWKRQCKWKSLKSQNITVMSN